MTDTIQKQNKSYMIPGAIVVAGLIVAGAIVFSGGSTPSTVGTASPQPPVQPSGSTDSVREVTKEDHIRGDINAPVKIVEYSDFECPFCKRFHETMKQVLDEYGDSGQVAWVYRQFPLEQLHPVKAMREAVVSECVAELGGNDAFWQFADRFFELTPSNNRTDLDTVLPQIISEIGLSQTAVDECVASGKYDQHIQADIANSVETGGRGTPWSVIIGPDGQTFPLSGAQPYASVKQLIDLALQAN
ncbi:disulfide bond formation protein DsbA [bacterium]|nr:disulfide bond formation protein DsbA [bacterium]